MRPPLPCISSSRFGRATWCATLCAAFVLPATLPSWTRAQTAPPPPVTKPIVYPAKGQSAQQQASDDGACYTWAKDQTHVDPAAVAAAPTQPAPTPQGQRVRGAARGAAAGAVVGGIANDDAGHGAAVGAAAGVVAGGAQKRQARRANAEAANQAQGQQQQALQTYYRAWGTCMQGRGYTVN